MMRFALAAGLLALCPLAARAQTPPAVPACASAEAPLGPLGRVRTVAFDAALSGGRICAVVVNLARNRVRATLGVAPTDAVVVASLGAGSGARLSLDSADVPALDVATPGEATAGRAVGPLLLAPGGGFVAPADPGQQSRVVLAFAGERILLIATSPIDLADLTRSLRERASALGTDVAIERAVILASGDGAGLAARTPSGATVGRAPATGDVLAIAAR